MPLESLFYVERTAIETDCRKIALRPGVLVRIKAPRRMGKTSLMARILRQAAQQKTATVVVGIDITERRQVQEALRQAQMTNQAIVSPI